MNPNTADHLIHLDLCATDIQYLYRAVGLEDQHGPMPNHLRWFSNIVDECKVDNSPVQILAPASHLKSTALKLRAIQHVLRREPPILFATASPRVRDLTSEWIRRQLKRLTGLQGEPWRNDEFTLPDPRSDDDALFPDYMAITMGAWIEGLKGGEGAGDDLIDIRSQYFPLERERGKEWHEEVYEHRLTEGAFWADWGSPWHPEDIYVWNAKRGVETHIFPMFGCEPPRQWRGMSNVYHHGGEYDVLWVEKYKGWTPERYMREKKMSRGVFEVRRQCNPWAKELMRFNPDWFRWFKFSELEDRVKTRLAYRVGDDPAVSEIQIRENSDWGYVLAARYGSKPPYYIIDAQRFQGTSDEAIRRAVTWHNIYHPQWVPERTTASGHHVQYLDKHTPLNVMRDSDERPGQKPAGPKIPRIESLIAPIEHGDIWFNEEREGVHELVQHFLSFPSGKMDMLDACEVGLRGWLQGKGEVGKPRHFKKRPMRR